MNNELPIYWTDPLQDEFEVNVVSCSKTDEHYEVTIDKECIRPAGGGQAGDQGWLIFGLDKVRVVDTSAKDGGAILHTETEVAKKKCILRIDMDWRLSMMRNHTGEHLLVALLVKSIKGLQLGYIWIDGEHGTVELVGTEILDPIILLAERDIQKFISKKLQVETVMIDARELPAVVRAREGVTDKHESLRLVKIEGVDASACSGIHVLNTSEIGFFKIIDIKRGEGKTRIEFVTADAAIEMVRDVFNQALVRKNEYPFEMEQVGHILDKGRNAANVKEHLQKIIEDLIGDGINIEDIGGVQFRHHFLQGIDPKSLRIIVKKLKSEAPAAVLLFTPGAKSNMIFWINEMKEDAKSYIGEIVTSLGGKGGGSASVFTGGFTDIENPMDLYENLVSSVRTRLAE